MNPLSTIPTINISELHERASAFALDLSNRLERFNRDHPRPKLSKKAVEYLDKTYGDTIPGPTPKAFTPVFERMFYGYMGSQYAIIPD
jgi:hypothetical protein